MLLFLFFINFLAALLENFSIFYNDNDTKLNLSVIKDFKRKWHYFDSHAKVSNIAINLNN